MTSSPSSVNAHGGVFTVFRVSSLPPSTSAILLSPFDFPPSSRRPRGRTGNQEGEVSDPPFSVPRTSRLSLSFTTPFTTLLPTGGVAHFPFIPAGRSKPEPPRRKSPNWMPLWIDSKTGSRPSSTGPCSFIYSPPEASLPSIPTHRLRPADRTVSLWEDHLQIPHACPGLPNSPSCLGPPTWTRSRLQNRHRATRSPTKGATGPRFAIRQRFPARPDPRRNPLQIESPKIPLSVLRLPPGHRPDRCTRGAGCLRA